MVIKIGLWIVFVCLFVCFGGLWFGCLFAILAECLVGWLIVCLVSRWLIVDLSII